MPSRPDSEERALWRKAMDGVAPLGKRRAPPPPEEPTAPAPAKSKPRSTPRLPVRPHSAPLPAIGADRAPGLDRRSAERLRAGEMRIEARLDFHGMTQAEAHRALADFIAHAHGAGRRCVLVITGKGTGDRGGVLREAVPRWLNEAPNRAHLLAFAPARPQHGGAGALYLLLRRKR